MKEIKRYESGHDDMERDCYDGCRVRDRSDEVLREIRAQAVEGFADYIALYNSNSKHHALDYATSIRAGEQP